MALWAALVPVMPRVSSTVKVESICLIKYINTKNIALHKVSTPRVSGTESGEYLFDKIYKYKKITLRKVGTFVICLQVIHSSQRVYPCILLEFIKCVCRA